MYITQSLSPQNFRANSVPAGRFFVLFSSAQMILNVANILTCGVLAWMLKIQLCLLSYHTDATSQTLQIWMHVLLSHSTIPLYMLHSHQVSQMLAHYQPQTNLLSTLHNLLHTVLPISTMKEALQIKLLQLIPATQDMYNHHHQLIPTSVARQLFSHNTPLLLLIRFDPLKLPD